jgi:ribosomal protein S6
MTTEHNEFKTNFAIQFLKEMDVDGETMEHILREVGMEEQMLRQLVMKSDPEYLQDLIEEKSK